MLDLHILNFFSSSTFSSSSESTLTAISFLCCAIHSSFSVSSLSITSSICSSRSFVNLTWHHRYSAGTSSRFTELPTSYSHPNTLSNDRQWTLFIGSVVAVSYSLKSRLLSHCLVTNNTEQLWCSFGLPFLSTGSYYPHQCCVGTTIFGTIRVWIMRYFHFLIPFRYGHFEKNDISHIGRVYVPWNELNTLIKLRTYQYGMHSSIQFGIKFWW